MSGSRTARFILEKESIYENIHIDATSLTEAVDMMEEGGPFFYRARVKDMPVNVSVKFHDDFMAARLDKVKITKTETVYVHKDGAGVTTTVSTTIEDISPV